LSLEGKTILITGAARRIGRALTLACARAGANVVIHHAHSPEDANSLRAEVVALGRRALILQAFFQDNGSVEAFYARALQWSPLYGLVNNAAIFESLDWETTSLEEWNNHLAVNLTAPFLLSQAFARALGHKQKGRIVNILDWRALRPAADHLPYTISKAGLAALTRSLALAFAPNITVNGLALGAILPPSDGGISDNLLKLVPAGRWADLDEVCQALLFFLEGPEYITGEILHVDGGRHLA
jgi:NAD(P)-dependent dehydrogenase (short-subunit alcohol dehydrogenase family)